MGLYYNPPNPHVGNQQPLEQRKLTPPQSGPAPQNPPFLGSRIGQAILSCWAVATVAIVLPTLMVPQQVAAAPLFKNTDYRVIRAWDAVAPAPIVAINMDPPISGPAPQNPPLIGARIPIAIQVGWLPPAPAPILAVNMDPPVSGPVVNNPPIRGAVIPLAVQISWIPPAPAPIVAVNMDPPIGGPTVSNPPFMGGAAIRGEVLISWLPPAPAPIVGPKFTVGVSTASNPPFAGGARVSLEIQLGWLPLPAAPITGPKFTQGATSTDPPFVGGARVAGEVLANWLPAGIPLDLFFRRLGTPSSAPSVAFPFTGSRVSREVLQAWDITQQPLTARTLQTISGPPASQPPLGGGSLIRQSILGSWVQPYPAPVLNSSRLVVGVTFTTSPRFAVVSNEDRTANVNSPIRSANVVNPDRIS